jgi:hypothetical protein
VNDEACLNACLIFELKRGVREKKPQNCFDFMSVPPPVALRKPVIPVVRALFKYEAQREDELSFDEGTLIYVLDKETDPSWWKCKIGNNEGYVPYNYSNSIALKSSSWRKH